MTAIAFPRYFALKSGLDGAWWLFDDWLQRFGALLLVARCLVGIQKNRQLICQTSANSDKFNAARTVPVAGVLRKTLTLRAFSRISCGMLEEVGKRPRGDPVAVFRFSRAEKTHA